MIGKILFVIAMAGKTIIQLYAVYEMHKYSEQKNLFEFLFWGFLLVAMTV